MTTGQTRPLVRVRHGATTVPEATRPYDAIHYRVFHPALFTGADAERQTGVLPPDTSAAPWPVLLLLGGINVNPDGYRWLATELATAGIATVLFHHVGEVTPGDVGVSPGLDISALTPDAWRTRPSATVVGPLLDALRLENTTGPLAGLLDLDRVALAGHSAGGTIALVNANPEWFPGVRAVISYAGHSMPAALLGHPTGTVLPVPGDVPALLLSGGNDAVIAASAVRYGTGASASESVTLDQHDPIAATFDRGASHPGSTLAVLTTATHLTLCDPVDPTTARGFLEAPDDEGEAHRALIASIVMAFLGEAFGTAVAGPDLAELAGHPLLKELRRR